MAVLPGCWLSIPHWLRLVSADASYGLGVAFMQTASGGLSHYCSDYESICKAFGNGLLGDFSGLFVGNKKKRLKKVLDLLISCYENSI